MEKQQFISILTNSYGWTTQNATTLAKTVEEKNGFDSFDWGRVKNYKTRKYFICEICHCLTPVECEGSEPNTCAMCMPLPDDEFMG